MDHSFGFALRTDIHQTWTNSYYSSYDPGLKFPSELSRSELWTDFRDHFIVHSALVGVLLDSDVESDSLPTSA